MKIDESKKFNYSEVRPAKTKITTNSILNQFPILKDENGKLFLNIHREHLLETVVKKLRIYYEIYNIKTGDRWDTISKNYYDTTDLWWFICWINDVIDPNEELQEGKEIIVIKTFYLYDILSELESLRKV